MRWKDALTRTALVLWLVTGLPATGPTDVRRSGSTTTDCGCPATCSCRAVSGCCSCSDARTDHQLRHPCECGRHHDGTVTISSSILPASTLVPPAPREGSWLAERHATVHTWQLGHRLERPPRTAPLPLDGLEA